jgi:hypothetical protein
MDNQSLQTTFPEAWRDFWKKRLLYWLSVVLFILGSIAVFRVWPAPGRSWAGLLAIAVLISAWAYARGELRGFVCPRCHKSFFFPPRIAWPIFLQGGCAHCGLPKYKSDQV